MSKRMDAREAIVRLINQAHAIHEAAWEALDAFDRGRTRLARVDDAPLVGARC